MMVLRTMGAGWLTLMMRAERARVARPEPDTDWLLHGPTDPEVIAPEADEAPPRLLAAE